VADAIADAKVNSQINGVTNTDFHAGDIKDLLSPSFLDTYGRPDVIITDPPEWACMQMSPGCSRKRRREGLCTSAAIPLRRPRPHRASEKYDITAVQPVDMFPHTMHVENVVRLDLK